MATLEDGEQSVDDSSLTDQPEEQPCNVQDNTHGSSELPDEGSAITSWQDFRHVYDSFDNDEDGRMVYTHCGFLYVDAEYAAYFYMSNAVRRSISLEVVKANLRRIPDEEIYPEISAITTQYTQTIGRDMWLKTLRCQYEDFKDWDNYLAKLCLDESLVYEILTRFPHPNIAKYHGCVIRRERIIGIVLARYPVTLLKKVDAAKEPVDIDAEAYMKAIRSGVQHLHSLGFAHNDIKPDNVMLEASGNLVIIDFNSCRPFGSEVIRGGTAGWMDEDEDDKNASKSMAEHDHYSLRRMEAWLEERRKEVWLEKKRALLPGSGNEPVRPVLSL